jgi:hypothetical protein
MKPNEAAVLVEKRRKFIEHVSERCIMDENYSAGGHWGALGDRVADFSRGCS